MGFEWDERKRISNLAKHGVDFRDVVRFEWTEATSSDDARRDYGEKRLIAVGPIDGQLCVLVYTIRGDVRRIISVRPANRKEAVRHGIAISASNP